ncbi:hypothetical protein QR680_012784 [Steinernema hermaphroditum]|uniref:Serine/threonine-protein kinase ATR n=1 Tax=Steinernema hermaphroditum TaxID=289476 RepID=A0AA39M142_9BILA|nr:hypothetical protein QR680_012784 [Steinernema hermaphroditum]
MVDTRAVALAAFAVSTVLFAVVFFPVPPSEISRAEKLELHGACREAPRPFEKLVLMVIDAWSWNFLEAARSDMPFVWKAIDAREAILFVANVQTPTVTLPRIKAIVSGTISSFVDVVFNFFSSDYKSDSLISILNESSSRMVFYGDDTWLKMFPTAFLRSSGVHSFFVRDFTEVDDNVTRGLDSEIASNFRDFDALFLHYLGLDHIGHSLGGKDPQIPVKLREMDVIVEKIHMNLGKLNHSSLLVVLGDHGMTEAGGHGGSSKSEVSVPIVIFPVNGAPLPATSEEPFSKIQQIDLVSSLSGLLGLRIPNENLGVSFSSQISDSVWSLFNLRQIVNAFLRRSSSERLLYCKSKLDTVVDQLCSAPTAHSKIVRPVVRVCQQELRRLQADLMSSQSFNAELLIFSLILSFTAIAFYFSSKTKRIPADTPLEVAFFFAILLEPLIYFASSLTEEEHDVWYFLYSSFLMLSSVHSPKSRRRRWNLEDSGESSFPDLSTVFTTFATWHMDAVRIFTVASLLLSRRLSVRKALLVGWILAVVRDEFVPLCVLNVLASLLPKSTYGSFLALMSSFYYLGNSNSISTIDISVGYTGLASYQPVVVAVQIALNLYSGPLIVTLLAKSLEIEGFGDLVVMSRVLSLAITMLSLFLQRHHLFVWTVFAPKFIYEIGHFFISVIRQLDMKLTWTPEGFTRLTDHLVLRSQALSEKADAENYDHDIHMICQAMDMNFYLIQHFDSSPLTSEHMMTFLLSFLDFLEDFLTEPVRLWVFSKHVEGASDARKMNKIEHAETAEKLVSTVVKLFPPGFVSTLILQLHRLLSEFSLRVSFNHGICEGRYRTIAFNIDDDGTRYCFVESLLNVVFHSVDFSSLSEDSVHYLWSACYKTITYKNATTYARTKAVSVIMRLLKARKCSGLMAIHIVDLILAAELQALEGGDDVVDRRELLKCLEFITPAVRCTDRNTWLGDLSSDILLNWARRCVNIIFKQRVYVVHVDNFASSCIYKLSRATNVDEETFKAYEILARRLNDFLKSVFRAPMKNRQQVIRDAIVFLIYVDGRSGECSCRETILALLSPVTDEQISETLIEYLNNLSVVIEALAESNSSSAPHMIRTLFPSKENIFFLLKRSCGLVDGSRVLTPLMTIVAGAIVCDGVDNNAIMSFLSVPWLMDNFDIDWKLFESDNQILRDVKKCVFQRSVPYMFQAKRITLQAISKFRFNDEWRKCIFHVALSNPEVFREALTYFPSFLRTLSGKDEEISNRRLFIRRAPEICKEVVPYLFNVIRNVQWTDVEVNRACNLVDECMDTLAEVFEFNSRSSFLSKAFKSMYAQLIACSGEHRQEATVVVDRLAHCMGRKVLQLVEDSFPIILRTILLKSPYDSKSIARDWQIVDGFLLALTNLKMKDFIKNKLSACIDQMLYNLSLCEEFCKDELNKMSAMQGCTMTDYSLTYHLRDTYLGVLLKFRQVLVNDEYYSMRPVLLRSLSTFMTSLDSSFMDKIAPRMIMVLRTATELGEISVPAWNTFVHCLTPSTIIRMLPYIFVSAAPILHVESAKSMLDFVRRALATNELTNEERNRLKRISAIMYDNDMLQLDDYLPLNAKVLPNSTLLSYCIQALKEEGVEVVEVVLSKLLKILPSMTLEDNVAARLVHVLLRTIRTNPLRRVHVQVSRCLGIIGAIDPARIAQFVTYAKTRADDYIDFDVHKNKFFATLLTNCAKLHMECVDVRSVDYIAFGIQLVLSKLSEFSTIDLTAIEQEMKKEYIEEIEPFKRSCFRMTGALNSPVGERPVASVPLIRTYDEWLGQWYAICADYVMNEELHEVFVALKFITSTGCADMNFGLFALCRVMIQLLIEGNEDYVKQCIQEMITVLQRAFENEGWPEQAAHAVFSVIDTAEKYLLFRAKELKKNECRESDDAIYNRVEGFIRLIMETKVDEDSLAVLVAQTCHCPVRALRWLEKYCIQLDTQNIAMCTRHQFFLLEKIYADLDNTDGVLGAFECIEATSSTSPEEAIVFFETAGHYNEALSFYKSGTLSVPLMKSLLRLNKPEMAWNAYASLCNEVGLSSTNDTGVLRSYQIEAAWRLSKWSDVDALVTEMESTPRTTWTWGSFTASIFSAIRSNNPDKLETRLKRARSRLASAMKAMTMEDSDTYSQCYKYILQLSILTEIEQGVSSLELLKPARDYTVREREIEKVLTGWKNRSDVAMNAVWIQEPMFAVRRSLLEPSNAHPKLVAPTVCNLLLQSSRVARQAGHHQLAWTFLVQAKDKGVNEIDVVKEESRYLFEKGESARAVTLLESATCRLFPAEARAFKECMVSSKSRFDSIITECGTTDENLAAFVKSKVLLCEYLQRGGESSPDDLYKAYVFLNKFGDKTEDLCYRVALFQDSYVYSRDGALDDILISELLRSYSMVLRKGRSHLFHAMPRILTIWLDTAQEIIPVKTPKSGKTVQAYRDASTFNQIIRDLFSRVNHFMFYTAFAQLISRITHPNESVFDVLKDILSTLIADYPHQCLWKSISVYRSSDRTSKGRFERCSNIYEVAKRKGQNVQQLISHYAYVAKEFMKVCDETRFTKGQTKGSISTKFPQIANFFVDGTMHDVRSHQPRGKPLLLLPLSELLEQEMEPPVHTLTQIVGDYSMTSDPKDFPSIFIDSVIDEFEVINSIARPKRCVLRGSDGKEYPILFKPSDELRKDSRVMDIARMVNSLLMQNADARRKNLSIRTYTVIPLQEKGGLIEWVPNLKPLRRAILPLVVGKLERRGQRHSEGAVQQLLNAELSPEERLNGLRQLYEKYPVVMSEWFRENFNDPARWYAARMAFTTTTAVMSMVGFILGLGDRHAENILLDEGSGQIIHVDYNMLFYKAEELRVPEVVPFRLTRNVIDGFGPTGVEGVYRKACETTMTILREKKDMLITVLQAFCHDPLLEWGVERSQQHRQNHTKGNAMNQVKPADEVVFMVEERLIGKIVSPKVFKSKLTNIPMSVQGQVAKLINIAKDERKLSVMYVGWAPHF